jgi:RimJ/RimL family protein N-acetyltransferase
VATVLRPLAGDDLDRLFVWENDDRAVRMAAFTRADSSDRRSFDAHYHRIRDNPDDTVLAVEDDGVLVGMVGSFPSEVGREVTFRIDPGPVGSRARLRRAPIVPGCRADPAAVRPGSRA